jgi:hypothetical protein
LATDINHRVGGAEINCHILRCETEKLAKYHVISTQSGLVRVLWSTPK